MSASDSAAIAQAAKAAFQKSQLISSDERVKALHSICDVLELNKAEIIAANEEDLKVSWIDVFR